MRFEDVAAGDEQYVRLHVISKDVVWRHLHAKDRGDRIRLLRDSEYLEACLPEHFPRPRVVDNLHAVENQYGNLFPIRIRLRRRLPACGAAFFDQLHSTGRTGSGLLKYLVVFIAAARRTDILFLSCCLIGIDG